MFPISQDPVGRIRQNNLIRDQTQTPATHTLLGKLNKKVARGFKMGRDVLLKKYNCIRLETFSSFASEISKVISDRVSMSNIKNRPMALVGKTLRQANAVRALFFMLTLLIFCQHMRKSSVVLLVLNAFLRQILKYCFCAIFSRILSFCAILYVFF